ncbi:RNA polymerase sigma factor [Filimonas effusa]|uniref:Sigma-70 family RNA polymerase sigma factor n=1 Tax=Filimonas effusa TaxID=2508721 RepID=A0A4Q1D3M5_9BACT|nr:sigma-70 family RNA polymerase sigma factor [Filimonas effusa]RXK82918.1 sigma-70 family RNA polymerase sigma factor [Filimonas effusa]
MTADPPDKDALLLVRISAGDMEAFTALYRYYQPRLQQRLLPFCPGADIENIIQEAFIKIWIKRELLPHINSFEGFLIKIARNLVVDMKRKATASLRRENKMASGTLTATDHQPLEYKEMYAAAMKAIDRLPHRQRLIYTLRVIDDYSLSEIVAITGLSKAVVVKQLYIASKVVRKDVKQMPLFTLLLLAGGKYLLLRSAV